MNTKNLQDILIALEALGVLKDIEELKNRPPTKLFGGGGGGSTSDHGELEGLSDDDHPQYFNQERGDDRYANVTGDIMQYLSLATTYTETGGEDIGTMFWDQEAETVSVKLTEDVTLQMGQEVFIEVKNQTGSDISNGDFVMFAGTLGASGRILVQLGIADGSLNSEYTVGIATEDIPNGEDGKVTWFGKVRGIDTSGTPYGEVWSDGDVLYASTTTAGALTNVAPTPPDQKIIVAAVIKAHASTGTLLVRPSWDGDKPVVQTKATILASTPTYNAFAYATDTKELMFYDGTEWREAPLKLKPSATGVSMGAYNDTSGTYDGFGDSDESGFNEGSIFGKLISQAVLSNTVISDNTERIEEGAIRVNNSTYQIYLNSQWNDIVINFRFREDDSGLYELEHKPIGFNEWVEVNNGNSNLTGLNGLPLVQQYVASMGAYPERILVSGRS